MNTPVLYGDLVARSPAMLRIFRLIDSLSDSDCPVLLLGEFGVGKDALARAIHERSLRWSRPYVRVDCAALPAPPLDRNAFSDRLALAREGTFVLANIAVLPMPLQRVLASALSLTPRPRPIATTPVALADPVAAGEFLADLAGLLQALVIAVPPLRERAEDIEPLARHLLARIGTSRGRALEFSPAAMDALLAYAWPENVSELLRAVEHAVAVAGGHTIAPPDLPERISHLPRVDSSAAAALFAPAAVNPRAELLEKLEACHWRRGETARALGISRATLWRRMRDAGL